MSIVVYPVQVQGAPAAASISRALRRCNAEGLADVVVIARGGGSFEEMFAFNNEVIARAILASALPVVTALGHTSDRTVADMVADAECRTPTEAGSRVVPKKSDLLRQLAERDRRISRDQAQRLSRVAERLEARRQRLLQVLPSFGGTDFGEFGADLWGNYTVTYDRIPPGAAELRRNSVAVSTEGDEIGTIDGFVVTGVRLTEVVLQPGATRIPIDSVTAIETDHITVSLP